MEISVLMSVYFKEKKENLKQALESIVNQTYKPKQIVIIKDGILTRELEECLGEYKKTYKDLIDIYSINKSDCLGTVLAYGVNKCKYEYIARMDSDDVAPLNRFEEQLKIIKQKPNIDILGGYIEEYDELLEKFICFRKVPLKYEDIKRYIKKQCPFNHGTVIMKKKSILSVGNYNDVLLEDYDLWARMLIHGCYMENIPVILGKNRTGISMYKRRSGIKQIKKILQIEKKLLEYNIINKIEYVYNIFIRSVFALLPVKSKKYIYKNYIRQQK